MITERAKGNITGHNGATGGFVSLLLIDRNTQAAAIVLSNKLHDIDTLGHQLLDAAQPRGVLGFETAAGGLLTRLKLRRLSSE